MYNSNDYASWSKYPEFQHVCAVQVIGAAFPKAGNLPMDNRGNYPTLDESGHKARIHCNGDMFAVVDGEWVMLQKETVDFVACSK